MIPYGYCHCGCGLKANIAERNNTKARQIKGEPYKYLKAHNIRRNDEQYVVDENGCWIWQWSMVNTGYGKMWDGEKLVLAHRWYYEKKNGPIDSGKYLCHKCDVRACVNPDHCFVGTQKDNTQDMLNKGRDNNPRKISDSDVSEIRRRRETGDLQRVLAKDFNVSQATIHAVVMRKRRFA
jgi:hypothetical protein